MSQESVCPICEAGFRNDAMVPNNAGVLVCKLCAKEHPDAKTRKDVVVDPLRKARSLTEDVCREIVYEILEEANISRTECSECGELFFRRSPAQKICPKCRAKKEAQ